MGNPNSGQIRRKSDARLNEAKKRVQQFLLSGFSKEKSKTSSQEEAWCAYQVAGGPSVEATSWAAIALGASFVDSLEEVRLINNGVGNFLCARQNKDGGWSTAPDIEKGKSDWNSAVALFCLRHLEASDQSSQNLDDGTKQAVKRSVLKGLDYLFDSRAEFYKPIARLLLLASKGARSLDYSRGWPWDPNCFHWVEPTCYSLIALKHPSVPAPALYEHVIHHANQFLLEHVCKGGGWNHGNDITLGAYLPPYRLTTAEALIALQDAPRDHKAIVESLRYLASQEDSNSSAVSLAWSILARHAYDQDPQKELSFLLERQNPDGSFGVNSNLHVSAVCLIALSTMSKTKDAKGQLVTPLRFVKS